MDVFREREQLREAELNYSQLSGLVKMQAGGVMLPMLALLRGLLDKLENEGVKNGQDDAKSG